MRYPKECVLKECQEAIIRPLEAGDITLLEKFYSLISEDDRWFMRYDVGSPEVLQKWFENIDLAYVKSIVGVCEDKIVGHGSLHLRGYGATQHVGRFRIIVLPEYRQKRLGTWLLLDLIQLAMDEGLEALRTDLVVGVDNAAIEAVTKFDFFKEAVLRDYAKDRNGKFHDIAILIKRLHRQWSDF
ncbi:MAG: GNAT family N-acetyltransferase [Desulfobacteraceae bacterium]|nr:GNAT family N-acetyltransferase [Desulfobacteraceae bacterium]